MQKTSTARPAALPVEEKIEPIGSPDRYVSYRTLLMCSRAVKIRGRDLLYSYAGENPEKRFTSFRTKAAARETARLLLLDLRGARSDAQYNQVIDSFRAAIREGMEDRARAAEQSAPGHDRHHDAVMTVCPGCQYPLQLSPEFVAQAQNFCPQCNQPDNDQPKGDM